MTQDNGVASDNPWTTEALDRLRQAGSVLVLTGAGMSAESGIPTFRDALTGLWSRFRPEELATPEAFRANPRRVWDWYEERRAGVRATSPHAGHHALADLESMLQSIVVVTQNVDGFHRLAGSTDVIELHGNILRSVCSETRQVIDEDWLDTQNQRPPPSPHHPRGLARPDVVWFGESLPQAALQRAFQLAQAADVVMSIGTSTLVQPAASLPSLAREHGAYVIEINPNRTPLSDAADLHLSLPAGAALVALANDLSP